MSGLDFNKIVASILVAMLAVVIVVNITDMLYQPRMKVKKRGYMVEVSEESNSEEVSEEEEIDIPALMAKANIENGKKISRKCTTCHVLNDARGSNIGPDLKNIVNRKQASRTNYSYSNAFKKQDDVWSYKNLFEYLKKPQKYIPGTKMSFIGLRKPEDIADLLAFLISLSSNSSE